MKKQIWFEPHQVELLISVCACFRNQLNPGDCENIIGGATKRARVYTQKRIDEILVLLGAKP
jgi:hypothetical protein